MTDREILLRAILVDPACDAARLVFADWLEGTDEPANVARAKFIRQTDAGLRKGFPVPEGAPAAFWSDAGAIEIQPGIPGVRFAVEAGFVFYVRCRLADWVGGGCERCESHGTLIGDPECGTCHGAGRIEDPYPDTDIADAVMDCPYCDRIDCPQCSVTGRTAAHGPRIVAEQPVTEVRTEKSPRLDGKSWIWWKPSQPLDSTNPPSDLPPQIFDLLRDYEPINVSNKIRRYLTEAAAQSALSLALVNWARREAGLPPLEILTPKFA